MARRIKNWRCANGHILGVIERNGDGTAQLALFRHAVDKGQDIPEEVDVLGGVLGRMPVRCDICGDVMLWDISLPTLAALSERFEERRLAAFLDKVQRRA